MSLVQISVAFKPLNLKIHRKNFFTGDKTQKHSIKYAPQSWTLVISFVKKYNYKQVKKTGFFKSFYWFVQKKFFGGGDCHDVTFVNLLCPVMLKYLKKTPKNNVDHILRCNVAKAWAKFGPNCQFSPKGNILVNLNVTFTYLLHPIMLVNISQISIEWIMKYKVA